MAISYSLAGLRNDTIVIDRTRAADPINHTMILKIKNQGTSNIYYKITESSGSWGISSPTNGELGSVSAGSEGYKKVTIQRALPTSDTVETIQFTLEAYSDSGYTNLIESTTFSLTAIIADVHSWPYYTKYGFDDGTTQGWTVSTFTVSSDVSITPGGYSLKCSKDGLWTGTLTRTVTIPSTSRAVLLLYYTTIVSSDKRIRSFEIKINGNTVYKCGDETNEYAYIYSSGTTWDFIGVDLSDYAGQSVTIDIVVYGGYTHAYPIYIDDIIIAGTNAL